MNASRGVEGDITFVGAVLETSALDKADKAAKDDFNIHISRCTIGHRCLVYDILVGPADAPADERTEDIAFCREGATLIEDKGFYCA